ncbi:uracil-DNA glycosylase [Orenia marismortui]|uniref:Type-4 uracil-DNA glycosylase n=1 Tax=Orenia marismortui TaxID=46469 RepID=A0A4R8H0M1_9FIRM|nr:uracil-DNA glycosylase [Orenia marismortui]TDX52758.1 DNA polymerase [Orenia marismortui]
MLFYPKGQMDLFNADKGEKRFETLDEVKYIADNCSRCSLRDNCTQVVFGNGNIDADLMFVGEGPGADEDRIGAPFVGKAGQLLNKILEAAEIKREEVYITNIVKCRPPGNRQPKEDEMKTCLWILAQEIKLVNPKIIVPLGSTALKGLLDPRGKITRVRGRWIKQKGYYFLPTFHPAALLRDKNKKLAVWKDFLKIKKAYYRYLDLKSQGVEV